MNVALYTLSVQVKTIEIYCHSAICGVETYSGTKCHALQDDHMYHENNKQQK